MLLKNATIYRLTAELAPFTDEVIEAMAFKPCGNHQRQSSGLSPVIGFGGEYAPHVHGYTAINYKVETKVLPPATVNKVVDEKVNEIQLQENRRVYRKERESIKEEVIAEMLPKAFTRETDLQAIIVRDLGLLIVNTVSYSRAEELIKHLRDGLGSLPAIPLQFVDSPLVTMTSWVTSGQAPERINIGDRCEMLQSGQAGAKHTCAKEDLTREEVTAILTSGKHVSQLAMTFDTGLSFILTDMFRMKQIRFSDDLRGEASDQAMHDGGDQAAMAAANLILSGSQMVQAIGYLTDCFGGLMKLSQEI